MKSTLFNIWLASFSILGFCTFIHAVTVANTILVIARDADQAYSAKSGLDGYGIPYEAVLVPSTGITLPPLINNSTGAGNYGGFIIMGEVAYRYTNGFASALLPSQWREIFNYQTQFGVRMVRVDVFPTPEFGTAPAIFDTGCCSTGVEQLLSFTDTSAFPTANLKTGATVSTQGLFHFPAVIKDTVNTQQIAKFGPGGPFTTETTAAIINRNGAREQMVWFTSVATQWNLPSNFIQHSWIHWITRGLYVGFRRIYFNTQVDDVFCPTRLYKSGGRAYRTTPADMTAHASWTANLNSRLPAGSKYFIELAHNGNFNIFDAVARNRGLCNPPEAIIVGPQTTTPLEFKKPLGTGTDVWPKTPAIYSWSLDCARIDPLLEWMQVPSNRDAFSHMSHTFSHSSLNNATYSDVFKEISFNKAWMEQVGISAATQFSPGGLVPPAITGLHNGDAIKAWMDLDIKYVVGDNTRPPLRNPQSAHWPLITTVERNGHAGLVVVPRWATTITFDCDQPQCVLQAWKDFSGATGDFQSLLLDAKNVNVRHLLNLMWDPFMFHQANMRQADVAETVVNGQSQKLSLLQIWVEVVAVELARLTDWPIITLKHDDISIAFEQRMARDLCKPNLMYNYAPDGNSIVSVTVTANGNACGVKIPVTFPGPVTSIKGNTSEKIGSDPLTVWVQLSGSPVTFELQTPVAVKI